MAKRQTSIRLAGLTDQQITELAQQWGMSAAEVISLCVDRVYREERGMDTQATSSSDFPPLWGGNDQEKAAAESVRARIIPEAREIAEQGAAYFRAKGDEAGAARLSKALELLERQEVTGWWRRHQDASGLAALDAIWNPE
jgi:hypothetical protein